MPDNSASSSAGVPAESRAIGGTQPVTATTSLLPDLPKETWDYLELRLWNSFSKRIWLLVGGLVTVLGLFAALGLNSWVQSKVDAALIVERAKLDKLTSESQAKSEAALVLSAIAFHIRLREMRDVENYEVLVRAFKHKFGEDTTKALLSVAEVSNLLWPLQEYGSFHSPSDDALKKAVAELAKKNISADVSSIEKALIELANASTHIVALREMAKGTERLLFTKVQADPQRLIKLYEEEILPKYTDRLKDRTAVMWMSTGERKVNSLIQSGQSEFSFYVPSYMDRLLNRDNK